MASIRGMSWVTSLRFAPVRMTVIGVPSASVATWCLEPGRVRSVGFGPVLARPNRADRRGVNDHAREGGRATHAPE